jgi:hypothetical protein
MPGDPLWCICLGCVVITCVGMNQMAAKLDGGTNKVYQTQTEALNKKQFQKS